MDKLVDNIVGQVLGKTDPAEAAGLSRPNYQRRARPCSTPESTPAAVPPPFPPVGSEQNATQTKNAGHVPPPFSPERSGCGRGCAACKSCCRDLEPGQTLPDLTLDTDQALRWLRLQNGGMEE